jgi:flagellar protein FlbD
MIELTSLSGSSFVLNSNLIETIETIPETKVTLTNGKYFLVGEEKEEIVQKIIDYNRQIFLDTVKFTGSLSETEAEVPEADGITDISSNDTIDNLTENAAEN